NHAEAYERLADNVIVRRFGVVDDRGSTLLKIVNMVWFAVRLLTESRKLGRVDAIMAASTPPIGIARASLILARIKRAAFVYHHQDIYPEILNPSAKPSLLNRVLLRIDVSTDLRCSQVVVLSPDMAETIRRRGIHPERIQIINNFDPWTVNPPSERSGVSAKSRSLVVAYTGNIGRFQGLDGVFDTLLELRNEDVEFHFIGDGPLRVRLEELVTNNALTNVTVHGQLHPQKVAEFLRQRADVGLVTLNKGVERAAYPSKCMTYLRNQLGLLTAVDPKSALVHDIRAYNAGWNADPDVKGELAEVIKTLIDNRATVTETGENARKMYESEFAPSLALARWVKLF